MQTVVEAVQDVFEALGGLDQLAAAAGRPREALEEPRVGGLVDADDENVHAGQVLMKFAEQLRVVADLAIADQHEEALAVRVHPERGQCGLERRAHHGAAPRLQAAEEVDGPAPLPLGGGHRGLFRRRPAGSRPRRRRPGR